MYHTQRKLPLEVKKSNELVRSQLSVENNALANRIFCALIRNLVEDSFPEISIPVSQIINPETKGGEKYKEIKAAARVLVKATVDSLFYDKAGKEIGFRLTTLFSHCHYEKGFVTAKFNPDLKPHLLGLKNHFTTLNYFDLIELSSFYSQRLYELLKSWEKPHGVVDVRLDALYDLTSFPINIRNNFKDVRKRALEQAEKEINGKTDLKFRWEPIKEGRKVVAIRFVIGVQGEKAQKKRQAKAEEKERQEAWEASTRRKPYLDAARQCRLDHGTTSGDICMLAKPRSKKCRLCSKTAGITYYNQDSLF